VTLLTFQNALVELYLNEKERTLFLSDRDTWLKEKVELDDSERKALAVLDTENLERFAHGLREKRLRIARSMFDGSQNTPYVLILLSAFRTSPVLYSKSHGKEKILSISPGVFRLLSFCEKQSDEGLSISSVMQAYLKLGHESEEEVSLVEVIKVVKLIVQHQFFGYRLKSPL
jgi:hypothetical protein